MRRFLPLLALLLAAAAPATYTNPILHADYSDPDITRVGRDYYLIASSFHFSPGIPVLRSRDLVHWKIIGHVLPKLPFAPQYDMPGPHSLTDRVSKPVGGTRYAGGVWAPSIRHHKGKFYVYWATPDEGVFMATARHAEGPWSAPVKVIDQPMLEDPAPFWDDDGRAWLVHSRHGAGPLILHRMSADGTRVLDAGKVIVEDKARLPILEGPKLYKRNGYYYIFAPIGGVEKGAQVALRARNIEGPYEHRVVLQQGSTALEGPHQGGWVETPSGEGWFAHFNSTGAFGRIVHLQPVKWVDDWPVIGTPIPGTSAGQPVATHAMPDTGSPPTRDRLQASDSFAGRTLGLQWEWNHNPDDSGWSLTERPGFLRLRALPAEHLVTARNTLTQILQGPASRITTRIDASRMADGQRAGLALFGVRPSWIGLVRENGQTRVTLGIEGAETPGPVLAGTSIDLRAEVGSDQTVQYAYSTDGGASFQRLGDPIALAKFSWWKGARPALFSFTRGTAGGSIDVDMFDVQTLGASNA
ncbi:family 43 glycosylhydrolase [Polymorphobacter fuscus]|uniref:Family 43 glycosylhydrolase n=2 Tax=Sandarakinorhabdus fusca TaxID=1439888 RepID=A0A7C9GZB0_9SPHN|nr:glycoside hydrolase 43 family protein [Polymorphobacter fuscus]KAB7644170.1 glycosyl hydrolase 43 family protein [Polymorphobacter fuscus]MQT18474.1 family 43 glycosylhydrolase [Polymorphobacter fuscus]